MKKYSMTINVPCVREAISDEVMSQPERVRHFCQDMAEAAQEMFVCLDLDSKSKVIDRRLVTLGIANASLVSPREVFKGAITNNAIAVILVHNHPSGNPAPSSEDNKLTRQLIESGKILGINVVDHVIIGRDPKPFYSMREEGSCSFA